MIELRGYQEDLLGDIQEAAMKHRRILMQMPTGAGKTCVAAANIKHAFTNGMRILFLAHRRELIWQCNKKLLDCGVESGIMLADYPYDPTKNCIIASIQSLYSKAIRRSQEKMPEADLVVVDEVHHATAGTWDAILSRYPKAFILGMTATPVRQTGKGLGHAFDTIVRGPTIEQLTNEGWLVPVKYFVPTVPDLAHVKIRNGDYVEGELERAMDKPELIGDVLKNWVASNNDKKKTLVFASGVKHSLHIAEAFSKFGVRAQHVDGGTPKQERDGYVREFSEGDLQVLTNCDVFTEGVDVPAAEVLVFARPTKSLRFYLQSVGRVLRPFKAKAYCTMLDHSGVVYEHGPIDQPWDWSLDYAEGTIQKKMQRAKVLRQRRSITCKNCKCVYEGRIDCPECHAVPIRHGKPFPTYDAYLQELDSARLLEESTKDKKTWYLSLLYLVRKMKKSDGWAAHLYREKYGIWPAQAWKGVVPPYAEADVKAWFYARLNAYRQRMQKQRHFAEAARDEAFAYTQAHGLSRKEDMAANAYQSE